MFDHAHPITIKVTFSFLKYVLAWKIQLDLSIYGNSSLMPIFEDSHPKIMKVHNS